MDNLTAKQRAACMSRIRSKNTKPEMTVRHLLYAMGQRFQVHRHDLPGRPDIVPRRYRKVIFVHGCFWHIHRCKYGRVKPQTNREYWERKRQGNVERHRKNVRALRRMGWQVLVIWECWTRDPLRLEQRLRSFLEDEI